MTIISKAIKEGLQKYGLNYPTNAKTKAYKELLKGKKWIDEQYIQFLKDKIQEARRKENQKIKKYKKEVEVANAKAEVAQRVKYQANLKNTSASRLQTIFLRRRLFRMKPSSSAWNSYNKYTIYNDRSNLYNDEDSVKLLKNFLNFYNVKAFLNKHKGHKVWIGLTCNNLDENSTVHFSSKSKLVVWNNDIDANAVIDDLMQQFNNYYNRPYGANLIIDKLDIHIAKVNALTGSSYKPLPDKIKNKKAIINIQNNDNKCFLYSVLCGIKCPDKNAERVSNYTSRLNELKYKEEDIPMDLNKIMFFEKKNNLKINVYGCDRGEVIPLYVSTNKDRDDLQFIHLFYYDKHYSYIKHFDRLFGQSGVRHLVCPYCCQFTTNSRDAQNSLENHMKCCVAGQRVEMPTNDFISFTHYSNINKCPIRIYADFETYNGVSKIPNSNNGNTIFNTQHKAASFKLLVVSDFHIDGYKQVHNYYIKEYMHKGIDADIKFIHLISLLEEFLLGKMQQQREANYNTKIMSAEDKRKHYSSTQCWICKCCYTKENKKVIHHNHDTGLYHSTICNNCNIQIKDKWDIPVMFHNLNYDKNVFFKSLVHMRDKIQNVSILADNSQSYKAFSINKMKFIDTMRFMNSSLAELIKNLPKDCMHLLRDLVDDDKFKYIKQKGYFPYEWFDCIDKLKFPITELKREHFDNQLTLSKLDDSEWEYIQELIVSNNMHTFEDFHDFYLHIDVNGLADVFESFRNTSLEYYKLEPCYYVGTPSYAWDAMLLKDNIKLELIKDIDMYLLLEEGIRGGQSVIFKKHSKANNKYLDDFDENQPSNYIVYLDANNLYGEAMSHKLPMNDFKWDDSMTYDKIMAYDEDKCDVGSILKVSLRYPEHLQDRHNDYPLAPEKLKMGVSQKLCGTFYDKKEYVVHIKTLKFYLEQGMILDQIHRCISFKQSAWLKGWIQKNTEYRKSSKNDFEKDYFKLMNNAVFGKTMENVRGRMDVKCAFDEEYFKKYTSKPNFNTADYIDLSYDGTKYFMLMMIDKKKVKLDKPIYAGFTILDLSKLHMFNFHYTIMKPKYNDKIQLLMTDTDSLVYEVQTDDIYKDMYEMKEHFDLSGYSKTNPIYDNTNNKEIGKFKDETGDKIIKEFVGVRPKCYSFITDDNKESKKLKGITKCVVKKSITFEHYKKCVFNQLNDTDKYVDVNNIRTKNFSNYSLTQKKKALDNNDDKRVWLGVASLAYGHYKLRQ